MCEWGTYENVLVKIPDDLSHSGKEYFELKPIDKCIAPIVEALQKARIWTRCSCCGHGKGDGEIKLQDGRTIIIKSKGEVC
jgi:hypothetical protein